MPLGHYIYLLCEHYHPAFKYLLAVLLLIVQTFSVRLQSVDGGARIASNAESLVEVLPNDSPFGVVSFDSNVFTAVEGDEDTVAMVPVARRLVAHV